jgi:hypothetical protein
MAERPKRLGELLVEWGLITDAQLEQALGWQAKSGRRLGVLLVEHGLIHATKLTQVLSYQFNLPFVSLGRVRFTPELLQTVPGDLARSRRVVPICRSGEDVLFVATDDPADPSLVEDLTSGCGGEVRLMVAAPDELQHVLDEHYAAVPSKPPPLPPRTPEPTGAVRVAVTSLRDASGSEGTRSSQRPLESYVEELTEDELELISQPSEGLLSVVVVESEAGFAGLCERAAEAQGLRMQSVGLMSAEALVRQLCPVAIVMMEDVFAMDRLTFTRLSIEVGAHLVIWSDALNSDYLEPLLAAAKRHHPKRAGSGG